VLPSFGDPFYVDLLGGREVWLTDGYNARGSRWFRVGSILIEQPPSSHAVGMPIQLEVDAPEDLLERAWDAGYSVEVEDTETTARLSVFDPTGRRIDLVPRTNV
jgi:catechol 2,3-dioxygenase-like lactoylglutathione lyase family enzyme